jgi:hypothetical protein
MDSAQSEIEFIKVSFSESIARLASPPYLYNHANLQFVFLIATVLLFFGKALFKLSKNDLEIRKNTFLQLQTGIWAILLLEIAIVGNFMRYFMFLWIPLYAFEREFSTRHFNSPYKRITSNRILVSSPKSSLNYVGYVISLFVLLSLPQSNYFTFKNDSVEDLSIERIKQFIGENDSICMLGDHRAFIFWPNKVFVYPTNENRNPFSSRKVFDIELIEGQIWKECSVFILQENWGFPPQTSLDIIAAFKERNLALYKDDGFSLFRQMANNEER